MGQKIPVLGHPSVTSYCVAMRRRGWKVAEIAARLTDAGYPTTPKRVSRLIWEGARTVARTVEIEGLVPVKLSVGAQVTLSDAARLRGLTTEEIAAAVLEAVAADGLIDAVLDDQTEAA